MQLNLTQAMMLALQTATVVQGADTNHDGKFSTGEIAAAVAQEAGVAAVAYPAIATILHTHPDRLQAFANEIAAAIQRLVAP